MPLSNTQTRDIEAILHRCTDLAALRASGPATITRGDGIFVFDDAGKRYFEASAGLWCAGLVPGCQTGVSACATWAIARACARR